MAIDGLLGLSVIILDFSFFLCSFGSLLDMATTWKPHAVSSKGFHLYSASELNQSSI